MTVPPVNLPCPGRIIANWSRTAYSTRQTWLISQLTSISEGLSPIRHPGIRLVGDGRLTTELEVAFFLMVGSKCSLFFDGWIKSSLFFDGWIKMVTYAKISPKMMGTQKKRRRTVGNLEKNGSSFSPSIMSLVIVR